MKYDSDELYVFANVRVVSIHFRLEFKGNSCPKIVFYTSEKLVR